jgi:hypothetical protein
LVVFAVASNVGAEVKDDSLFHLPSDSPYSNPAAMRTIDQARL